MRNHWAPSLGQNPFSIFRAPEPREDRAPVVVDEPVGDSIFSILRPAKQKPKGNLFFSKAEMPVGTSEGDPFSAAASKARERKSFKGPPSVWKPYPRMREGYAMLSGPECQSCSMSSMLENPAFWLIAGTGVLIALEATGVTHLSSQV